MPEDNINFLSNPQRYGTLCLQIEFPDKSLKMIQDIFNLEELRYNRRIFLREYSSMYERSVERLPVIIPKIFSYLRSVLTKKNRETLPDMFPIDKYTDRRVSKYSIVRRIPYYIRELTYVPSNLGKRKQTKLRKAAKYYLNELSRFVISPVPDNLSKFDFIDNTNLYYFQVIEDDFSTLKILSPKKDILQKIDNLFVELGLNEIKKHYIKFYSPENLLMEMYIPILNISRGTKVLNDKTVEKNIFQALEEIKEERFAHCIRAIGIGAEELLVEIYETFIREKAKEAPLGNLLSDLNSKLQVTYFGKSNKKDIDFKTLRITLGKYIEKEKNRKNCNNELITFLKIFQSSLINTIERNNKLFEDLSDQTFKNQNLPIFPLYVLRCLNELIALRNRVSHRIERGTSISNVGYIEAAISIRSFIGLVFWWQKEKLEIEYSQSRKDIIESTIERSKKFNEIEIN